MTRFLILISLILYLPSCNNSNNSKVTVAVSANMQYAMAKIVEQFEIMYPSIHVETSSGSSGVLASQIRMGAPYDLFVSANLSYPKMLYSEGLATSSPEIYGYGRLILWTMKDSIVIQNGISSLLEHKISKIALANNEIAPYGMAAMQAIKKAQLYDTLKSKLIIGESISQVNQYVRSQVVDVGITSKSVWYSPNIANKGSAMEIPTDLYEPISQGIVILKRGKEKNLLNTEIFYNFMFSETAKAILLDFGYDVN